MLLGHFAANAWHPRALFRAGEPGLAFDFTRASLLYQDAARTTLVNASGDPIGSVTDLSGNGNNAWQLTAASRPTWQDGYASLDGADDSLATSPIDFSGTQQVTIVACARPTSNSQQILIELSNVAQSGNAGALGLQVPTNVNDYRSNLRYSGGGLAQFDFPRSTTPSVLLAEYDFTNTPAENRLRMAENGSQLTPTSATASAWVATDAANAEVCIGRRASNTLWFAGRIYRLGMIGRFLSTAEKRLALRWAAKPAGIVLP